MMLKVQGLSKRFGGVKAVSDVSLQVEKGEIVGLIGPNGAGKTTLFNMISHFIPPDKGEVIFDDHNISGYSPQKISRMGLLRTFQTPFGFPHLSCLENLMMVAPNIGENFYAPLFKNKAVKKREEEIYFKALGLLEKVNLLHKRNELVVHLSAGELKLLEISRQLMADPKLLMLDEPASGVNPAMLGKMIDHIKRLRDGGMTLLIIDHNLGFIMNICDRIYVLAQGELIASGNPEEIATNQNVKSVYLGGEESGVS